MLIHQKQEIKEKLKKGTLFMTCGLIVISITVLASLASAAEKPFAGKTIAALLLKDPYYYGLEPQIPEFEAKTGIKVNIVSVPVGQSREKLLADFIAHTGVFDVPYTDKPWIGEFMTAGYLYPLDDFVKRDAEEMDFEDFLAPAVEAFRWRGELGGLGLNLYPQILMYRKDLYAQFGLSKPETLDEWRENSRKLTKDLDGDGKTDIYGISICGKRDYATATQFLSYAALFGGRVFERYPEEPWDFTPAVNSPAMLEALRFYKDMQEYAPPEMLDYSWYDAGAAFWTGKAAQLYWYMDYAAMANNPEQSMVIGKIDYGLPPFKTTEAVYECGTTGLSINADSRNKEAAWEFIKWVMSKETLKKIWVNNNNWTSFPRKSLYEDPEILNMFPFIEWGKKALGPVSADVRPRVPAFAEIAEILALRINQVLTDKLAPEEALDLAQKEVIRASKDSENW